jgi:hypothetical protein
LRVGVPVPVGDRGRTLLPGVRACACHRCPPDGPLVGFRRGTSRCLCLGVGVCVRVGVRVAQVSTSPSGATSYNVAVSFSSRSVRNNLLDFDGDVDVVKVRAVLAPPPFHLGHASRSGPVLPPRDRARRRGPLRAPAAPCPPGSSTSWRRLLACHSPGCGCACWRLTGLLCACSRCASCREARRVPRVPFRPGTVAHPSPASEAGAVRRRRCVGCLHLHPHRPGPVHVRGVAGCHRVQPVLPVRPPPSPHVCSAGPGCGVRSRVGWSWTQPPTALPPPQASPCCPALRGTLERCGWILLFYGSPSALCSLARW